MNAPWLILLFAAAILTGETVAAGGPVPVRSPANKHNLSTDGPGPVRGASMSEICVFCHTPHNSTPARPGWSHSLSGATYTSYSSSTMAATMGVPTGSSKLCLSCHDGTIGVGQVIAKGKIGMLGTDAQGRMTGAAVLGTNLSDDHPIAFVPVTGAQIVMPPAGDPVKLGEDGKIECRSCHDPHEQENDVTMKKFLVKGNASSALCLTCHNKSYWTSGPSSHQSSTKSYTAVQGAHTGYVTVATNGCESCHRSHTAPAPARLLKGQEETTCGTGTGGQCHGSSGVARYNIVTEFSKTYRHPTYSTTPSVHDASESPANVTYRMPETSSATARHAECADCHNPHAAYNATASAPKGGGKLAGVWGIDSNGVQIQPSGTPPSAKEYEICYKCHADSANKPQPNGPYPPYPSRQIVQFNVRMMFDPANPSYHPIEAAGRNTSVPSLIAPWTTSSIMYCTDCHGSDSGPTAAPTPGTGPGGVHGSNQPHILVGRFDDDSQYVSESATVYALCYKCHSRTSILGDQSFPEHRRHIERQQTSCGICHDSHGISSTQGNAVNNAHLINFDTRYVTPYNGVLRYESTGYRSGQCTLTCHGTAHRPLSYQGNP